MAEYESFRLNEQNQHKHLPGMAQLFYQTTGDSELSKKLESRIEVLRKEPCSLHLYPQYRYDVLVGFYLLRYNSNLHKNKAQIDELIVAGDYSEGGVGDRCIAEAIHIITSAEHFKKGPAEFRLPIHVEVKMDIPVITKKMSKETAKAKRQECKFKLDFLKRNGFKNKRPPSKSSGISEFERVLPNE